MNDKAVHVDAWTGIAERQHRGVWAAGLIASICVAGTLAMWAHYGSTVFFETILAGIASCL